MRIFLYEFVTGGGLYSIGQDPDSCCGLLREGLAMLNALLADFSLLPGCELLLLRDQRLDASLPPVQTLMVDSADNESRLFRTAAAEADYTLLIAPETANSLLERVKACEHVGGHLLSPDSGFCQLAGNKLRTLSWLKERGIPVPDFREWNPNASDACGLRFPLVIKPVDGCGSSAIRLIRSAHDLPVGLDAKRAWMIESFQQGMPASVGVISAAHQQIILPACSQWLSDDDEFQYLGGHVPLHSHLNERAQALAARVEAALPNTRGYWGIDLVLGSDPSGLDDRVIEVNPRLTTSYVGLRAYLQTNLAQVMLNLSNGLFVELIERGMEVEFSSGGDVWHANCAPGTLRPNRGRCDELRK